MVATLDQIAEEARRARKVRQLVDITTSFIMQSEMTRRDAESLVQSLRIRILELFPDGDGTYELIYAPRFRRLIREFTAVAERAPGGVVVACPTASR